MVKSAGFGCVAPGSVEDAVVLLGSDAFVGDEVGCAVVVRAVAANLLEASIDDIELADGMATVKGVADASLAISDVEKVFSVEDCGTVINPNIVEGQIRGGFVQGIGASVFEELAYDESGQLLTTTFLDYGLPTMDVSPPFEIRHLETPSKMSASGVKGMGESGLIAAPAAVLNAVNDALSPFGTVLRDLPLSPEKVFNAMAGGTKTTTTTGTATTVMEPTT